MFYGCYAISHVYFFSPPFLLSSHLLRGDVGRSNLLQLSVYDSVLISLCHPSVFSLPS